MRGVELGLAESASGISKVETLVELLSSGRPDGRGYRRSESACRADGGPPRPVAEISAELEHHEAKDIITAAMIVYGKDASVSTAFGAGGLCVMDMAQEADPDVRTFYIDTGFGFEETEELAETWVKERRLKLLRVLPALTPEEQAAQHGDELWRSDPDQCCAIRKVEPNNRALEGVRLWIAALRRDESPSRRKTPILQEVTLPSGHKLLKLCPIARWTKKEVWKHIVERQLPYNELHDRGYPSIGCTHCTRPVRDGGDEREGRWAGTGKLECGLHIVQRKECC